MELFNPIEFLEVLYALKDVDLESLTEDFEEPAVIYKNREEIFAGLSEYDKAYYTGYIETTLAMAIIPVKLGKVDKLKWGKTKTINEIKWTHHWYKHFPKKWISNKDVIKLTKYGDAKYFNGIDIKKIQLEWWEKWTPISSWRSWKVMEYEYPIWAKKWQESKWQRVEESAWVIHGHPITEQEYNNYLK